MKAIIIGGTGATGKNVIYELLKNNSFEKITALVRREIPIPEQLKEKIGKKKIKNMNS